MGQKITEYPQVDLWLKHTREADKAGATLPYRESSDRKELSKYAEMERARSKSAYSILLPASMVAEQAPPAAKDEDEDEDEDEESATEVAEVAGDDAPGAASDETDEVDKKGQADGDSNG